MHSLKLVWNAASFLSKSVSCWKQKIERNGEIISSGNAVNEAVIHPAKIAHMIDFHVYIND